MKFESPIGPEVITELNSSGDILSFSITVNPVTGILLFDNVAELLYGSCLVIERGVRVSRDGMEVFPDDS